VIIEEGCANCAAKQVSTARHGKRTGVTAAKRRQEKRDQERIPQKDHHEKAMKTRTPERGRQSVIIRKEISKRVCREEDTKKGGSRRKDSSRTR